MREGLRQLFSLEEDLQVVGEAVDGLDALQKIRQLSPDVVLMDINMPIIDGITLTRQITEEFPSVAVIMLTMYQQQQQPYSSYQQPGRAIPQAGGAGACVPSGFARLTRNCSVNTGGCQRLPESCNRGWCCP